MKNVIFVLILFFNINNSIHSQVNLEDGLVAFYPFNGNANDESGNGLHAVVIDNPVLVADCENNPESAYRFDGIDDYIEVSNDSLIDFGISDQFAISVWINSPIEQATSDGTVSDIISKWSSAHLDNPYSYTVRMNNQNHNFPGAVVVARYDGTCGIASKIESTITVNDEQWHNIIFQRLSNDTLELFIDGQLAGAIEDQIACEVLNNENILFGLRSLTDPLSVHPFTGIIDNIRIYNRALNQLEIEAIYSKTTSIEIINFYRENINIYPNPITNNAFFIDNRSNKKISEIKLFELNGKFLCNLKDNNVPSLNRGIYLMKLIFEDFSFYTDKVYID